MHCEGGVPHVCGCSQFDQSLRHERNINNELTALHHLLRLQESGR